MGATAPAGVAGLPEFMEEAVRLLRGTAVKCVGATLMSLALVAAIPAAAFADGHGQGDQGDQGNHASQAGQAQTSDTGGEAFDDLGGFSWAMSDISVLARMGIFKGEGDRHFGPEGHLTRAQFAALMDRMFHLSPPATPEAFVDVQPGFWAYGDIEAAAPYMSVFQVPSGTAFEPDLDMTRIEVAATIGRIEVAENLAQLPSAYDATAIWAQFSDGSQVPTGLEEYAAVAVKLGFMKGYPDGSFGVDRNLNRAEAAVLLYRVLQSTETIGGTTSGTGYLVGDQASSVVVGVYGSAGVSVSSYLLAPGATVTVNGQAAAASALPEGDAVSVTLNGSNEATAVAATTPSVTVVKGTFQSAANGSATVTVNGTNQTVPLGSSPVIIDNEQSVALSTLATGSAVTIDEGAINGSALVITGA